VTVAATTGSAAGGARPVEYRKAVEGDLEGLFALWWEMHQEHLAYEPVRYGLQPEAECRRICLERFGARLADPDAVNLVAAVGGQAVGMLLGAMTGRPPTLKQFRVLAIDNVVVAGKWRRRGILRQLMDLAAAEARSRGAACIDILYVEAVNPAVHAYEKLGFACRELTMTRYLS
jgi:ribosomal protein S18 acetylase RimI-like enzyme